MGAIASCHNARSISNTIDGQTMSLPPQATHRHEPCRSAEVTFHAPGTQERKAVYPGHGER
jgi:hypothetical protein